MRAWARMADIRLQQDRRHRPRLPLLRRPQGAERLQRPEDDASQDREGVEQGAQRRPEADRRDRQLQQARLVEVQGGPRVVRPHSEPSAQGQGGPGLPVLLREEEAREADKARLALGPSARKEWGGGRSVPPAYRRDLANIGLDGHAWQLWGSASFPMAGFMYASTLMRRIVPLGICPNGTICYPIRRRLFGAGSSPMKVGMSCKSLEAQTPEDK